MSGRGLAIGALLAGTCMLAVAVPAYGQDEARWFVGGSLGLSRVDGYELEELASDVDDEDVGWRIYAGRHFGRYFAVAASYVDFGSVKSVGSPVLPVDFTDRVDVDGIEVTAMGLWPITERIELYGTASYLRWDQQVELVVDGNVSADDATGSSSGLGGGLNFHWRDDLMVTLDARRYIEIGDREATGREHRRDLFTAGVTFRFGD